jgi:hypothetical protein
MDEFNKLKMGDYIAIGMWIVGSLILIDQLHNLSNTQELIKLLCYSFLPVILISPLILKSSFSFLCLTTEGERQGVKIFLLVVMMLFSIGTCSYINVKYSNFEVIRSYNIIDREHTKKQYYIWIYMNKTPYKVNAGYESYKKYYNQNKIPMRHISGLFNVEVIIPVEN